MHHLTPFGQISTPLDRMQGIQRGQVPAPQPSQRHSQWRAALGAEPPASGRAHALAPVRCRSPLPTLYCFL
jgi:hypothetical protein